MPDLFETQLLEVKWRDVAFPITNFRTRLSHDIAEHKRPDQDGARVESTGRNPLVFSASCLFRNGVTRGRNETWSDLYPANWRSFLVAFADRTKGTLQHPSLGKIACKPVTLESELSAQRRDGEDVSAEWIEYSEDEATANGILSSAAITGLSQLGRTLDSYLGGKPEIKKADPDDGKMSLEDALKSVTAIVDTASLLSKRAFGVIDRIAYRLDRIAFAITSLQDPTNWPAKESIARLRAALERTKRAALKAQGDTKFYVTPAPMTLAILAPKFKNSVNDLVRLNPHLVSAPELPKNTIVRYYAAA